MESEKRADRKKISGVCNMNYGQKIAELRKGAQMTQTELGEQLNVTSQAVSKWENGLSEPDLETINKICSLFNVSANEFFGTTPAATETAASAAGAAADGNAAQAVEQKVIAGYCERCHKPVSAGEYKIISKQIAHRQGKSTTYETLQQVFCKDCAKIKEEEDRREKERQRQVEKAEKKKELNRGLIWGGVGAAVALIFSIVFTVQKQDTSAIIGGYISVYGFFAMISQIIWGNSVSDVFAFFKRSFTMPGVIFTLDIDGIIWAICVKILLSILSVILSVLCLIVGLFVTMFYAMILFPFGLVGKIREVNKV